MTEPALAARFKAALPENARTQIADDAALERQLAEWTAAARAGHPEVELDAGELAAHLGERFDPAQPFALERLPDLYLAAAAAAGVDSAITVFERELLPDIKSSLDRLRLDAYERSELEQRLREELFVRRPDRRPKIAEYAGRGDLRGWLRVTAVRLGLKVIRARRPHEDSDSELEHYASEGGDPELMLIKAEYRPVFKASFQRALDSLEDRERLLLKQTLLDGLTVDQLGALHQVHRATAARWVASARETLLGRLRRELMGAANISARECDSVLDLVRSGLLTTLKRRLSDSD